MGFLNKVFHVERNELIIAVLIAFFLPLEPKIVVYLILILGVNNLYSWVVNGVNRLTLRYWPFIILFGLYLIGLIFTSNFDYGLKDIETRLTYVLFPLFFGLTKREKPIQILWIALGLTLGCIVNIVGNIFDAYQCFEETGYNQCFQGSRFADPMHPSYLGLYVIGAGTFLVLALKNARGFIFIAVKILIILGGIYTVYILYSMGPWIGIISMFTFLMINFFYVRKKMKLLFIGFLIIAGAIVASVNMFDLIKRDYNAIKDQVVAYNQGPAAYIEANKDNVRSTNARIMIWNTSFDLIFAHPFGVGTGDIKDELYKLYKERGMDLYIKKELNPHCQFLQTAAAIGIVSGLFFMLIFIYYLWIGFKENNNYLIALTALFGATCLFESVLERQWGILFFMFFLSIFLTKDITKPKFEPIKTKQID